MHRQNAPRDPIEPVMANLDEAIHFDVVCGATHGDRSCLLVA